MAFVSYFKLSRLSQVFRFRLLRRTLNGVLGCTPYSSATSRAVIPLDMRPSIAWGSRRRGRPRRLRGASMPQSYPMTSHNRPPFLKASSNAIASLGACQRDDGADLDWRRACLGQTVRRPPRPGAARNQPRPARPRSRGHAQDDAPPSSLGVKLQLHGHVRVLAAFLAFNQELQRHCVQRERLAPLHPPVRPQASRCPSSRAEVAGIDRSSRSGGWLGSSKVYASRREGTSRLRR